MFWKISFKLSLSCMMILGAITPFLFIDTTARFFLEKAGGSAWMAMGIGTGAMMLGIILLYGLEKIWKE